MFNELYDEIPHRLDDKRPKNGFNLEDLFTKEEWQQIGDGTARQQFGSRFANDVKRGVFPGVSRNGLANELGGNEARYNFDPEA